MGSDATSYGCRPTRYLSDDEAYLMMVEAMDVGGPPAEWAGISMEQARAALADPEIRAEMVKILAAGHDADWRRVLTVPEDHPCGPPS